MSIVSTEDLENAEQDTQSLGDFINGAADLNGNGIIVTRLGTEHRTLSKVVEDTVNSIDPDQVAADIADKANVTYVDQLIATHTHALLSITGGGDMQRLGTLPLSVNDWNQIKHNGWYVSSSTDTLNQPDTGVYYGTTIANTATSGTQLLSGAVDGSEWFRSYNGAVYGAWVRRYTTEVEIRALALSEAQGAVLGYDPLSVYIDVTADRVKGQSYQNTNPNYIMSLSISVLNTMTVEVSPDNMTWTTVASTTSQDAFVINDVKVNPTWFWRMSGSGSHFFLAEYRAPSA